MDIRGNTLAFAHLFGLPLVPLRLARHFVALGTDPDFAVAVGLLVAAALLLGDKLGARIALLGPPLALGLTEWVAKPLVGRNEVIAQNGAPLLGFPSGHTTAVAALAMAATVVAYRRWGLRGLVGAAPLAALLPLAMVATVVRLHYHLLSDGIGGVAVGYGTVLGVVAVVARPAAKGAGSEGGLTRLRRRRGPGLPTRPLDRRRG
jgi:membrane-associated phospholipid phosphatase